MLQNKVTTGLGDNGVAVRGSAWASLLAPLNSLPRRSRWWMIALCTALVVGWSALRNGDLMVAWGLPDVAFYVKMARGRFGEVPQPFSARPLAPLLAHGIAAGAHIWVEGGFTVLAYLSLLWAVGVVFWLLSRSAAPRWVVPLVAVVPFWPQLLGYAGLPDPLYTALLAALLVALEREWLYIAAALMFPLMLARESTSLTLVCLLLVAWRKLRWAGSALAIGAAALGSFLVHRLTAGGLPNPEHLSGPVYMVGKVISNGFRSLGLLPWSNVYQDLCGVPAWQHAVSLGPVRSVGVCKWSSQSPAETMWALLTTFGVLPVLGLALWRRWGRALRQGTALVRFCLLYGAISLFLAPALGTWYARLFGYAWPLLVVGVPPLLALPGDSGQNGDSGANTPLFAAGLLLLQCLTCAVGEFGHGLSAAPLVFGLQAVALLLVTRHFRAWPAPPNHPDPSPLAW